MFGVGVKRSSEMPLSCPYASIEKILSQTGINVLEGGLNSNLGKILDFRKNEGSVIGGRQRGSWVFLPLV